MVGGSNGSTFPNDFFWDHWISMTGSKRMGILVHKPNKDLAFIIGAF